MGDDPSKNGHAALRYVEGWLTRIFTAMAVVAACAGAAIVALIVGIVVLTTGGDPSQWHSMPMATGVSRWQRIDGQWRPVSFVPITVTERLDDGLWMAARIRSGARAGPRRKDEDAS